MPKFSFMIPLFFLVIAADSTRALPLLTLNSRQATTLQPRSSNQTEYLPLHNSIRAQHGAAPLTWSNELASKAQQWANGSQFKHSGGTLGPFGENIASGTADDFDGAAAINMWVDQNSPEEKYDPSNPQPSHFTQVVWKKSTQLGCANTQCSFGHFHVCEYEAAGNVLGQFEQNVQL